MMKRRDAAFNKIPKCRLFINRITRYIMVTRFNNKTYKEYEDFHFVNIEKELKDIGYRIYNTPKKIGEKYELGCIMLLLEMNNDKNELMGISRIHNMGTDHVLCDVRNVYEVMNYNRYSYEGVEYKKIHEKNKNDMIIKLEECLFKGYHHMKRGTGIERCGKMYDNEELIYELEKYMRTE